MAVPVLPALTLLPRSAVGVVRSRRGRDLTAALLGAGLGLWAWFVAFLVIVGFLRGPLYGFVVPGPYDDAWGGPTFAGAWAVHALVWVGTVLVAIGLWWAVVALDRRVGEHLDGSRRGPWSLPLAGVLLTVAVAFVWLWSRQA